MVCPYVADIAESRRICLFGRERVDFYCPALGSAHGFPSCFVRFLGVELSATLTSRSQSGIRSWTKHRGEEFLIKFTIIMSCPYSDLVCLLVPTGRVQYNDRWQNGCCKDGA